MTDNSAYGGISIIGSIIIAVLLLPILVDLLTWAWDSAIDIVEMGAIVIGFGPMLIGIIGGWLLISYVGGIVIAVVVKSIIS